MPDTLLLRFAQEELIYLQRALQMASFPALEAQLFEKLDEDHQSLAMAIADRTLRARSVVRWDSATVREVDPLTAGLLRDHTHPQYSLFVDNMRKDQPDQRFLYTYSKAGAIEHSKPEPGVHQFVGFPTAQAFVKRLSKMLDLQGVAEGQGSIGWISRDRWAAAQEVAPINIGQALYIVSAELPEETAKAFATTLYTPSLFYHLALWKGIPDAATKPRPEMALTILQGKTGLFLVWQKEQHAARLEVIPARVRQAWEYIEKMLHAALAILPAAEAIAS